MRFNHESVQHLKALPLDKRLIKKSIKDMKQEQFDELWARAEAERYGAKLAAEYPAWRTRQRRRMSVAALVLVVVGTALPLTLGGTQPMLEHEGYAKAYCNKADIEDQYWVDLAGDMLMEEMKA